ncbi:MAG: T9SS type A sorting domain-containing protein [Saprospiraceae bacterium]
MVLSLIRIIGALLCVAVVVALHAQSFTTPGLPWTYVPDDQVPAYAIDTAQIPVVLDYHKNFRAYRDLEVRHLYRIHFHPLLMELDSLGRMTVEIPRNPEESELVVLESGHIRERIAIIRPDTFHRGYSVGGFRSQQAPELSLIQVLIGITDGTEFPGTPDSTVRGDILLGPKTYLVHPNSPGDADAWAYFIQFVDSIWHPPLVSSVEEIELPPDAAQLSVYPNPARRGSVVNVAVPSAWRNDAVSLRLYDPTGRRVQLTRHGPAATHQVELPVDCAAGMYTLTAYKLGGELAVGRVVVR